MFAAVTGGRWNPPDSFPTLYLNEDVATARANLSLFIGAGPYEPEDLLEDEAPVLVVVELPRAQEVAEVTSSDGVAAVGLPSTYPNDGQGQIVGHEVCQAIGVEAHEAGLRGVHCRSARLPDGRELAWFPATSRSRARPVDTRPFADWYWS